MRDVLAVLGIWIFIILVNTFGDWIMRRVLQRKELPDDSSREERDDDKR